MNSEPAMTAPSFGDGPTIDQLVLPVVEGSLHDRGVPLVAALATAWGLPLRLIHVSGSVDSPAPELAAVRDGMRSWYPSIEVSVDHVQGDDPADAIASELGPQTLAVVASDDIDKWRFKDSVAESLVHRAGVPVLLLGPNVTKAAVRQGPLEGDVVLGLDGEASAEKALEPAVGLARALHRGLWLVTVVPQPRPGQPPSADTPGRYLQEVAERYTPALKVRWEVIQHNDPVEAIEAFANRRQARFLVASSGGRTDSSHHYMASMASGLVATSARPVLLLSSSPNAGPGAR